MMYYKSTRSIIGIVALAAGLLAGCAEPESGGNGNPASGGNGGRIGSSKAKSKPVTVGETEHIFNFFGLPYWFRFQGTGSAVVFETKGDEVDTYMMVEASGQILKEDDNNGDGNNARIELSTKSGTTYFIRVTTEDTGGAYTFVVK